MSDLHSGQYVRVVADARIVDVGPGGAVTFKTDAGAVVATDVESGFELRTGFTGWEDWAVELEPGGYLHVFRRGAVEDPEGVARDIAAHCPSAVLYRRRVDVGPWEAAPEEDAAETGETDDGDL